MNLTVNTQIETTDDNIYYNVNIVNKESFSQYATFTQKLTNQIIDDYYLAVAKFSLNGSDLPIFLWKDDFYYVSLMDRNSGLSASAPLIYPGLGPPTTSYGPYGPAIYSYQQFTNAITNAYAVAFKNLNELVPGGLPVGSLPPYFSYDNSTGLISVYGQSAYYDIYNSSNPISIFVDLNIYHKIEVFWVNYLAEGGGNANHLDVNIIMTDLKTNNNNVNTSIPSGYLKMSQEGSNNIRMWDPFSITFKSNTTGLRSEYTSLTSDVGLNNQDTGIPPTDIIITDFIPDFSSGDQICWRQQLLYLPSSYQLIDLLGNQSNSIDINIYWNDKMGNQYPWIIQGGSRATIKIAFLKKSLHGK